MASQKTPIEILNEIRVKMDREWKISPLKLGQTMHVIQQADTFGPGRPIEGYILVEEADGTIHRINGSELAQLNEMHPEFLKAWKLGK